ncbi:hypothetical protein FKW77_003407 [Venturia effusa]|uniref:Uncharacterized protein n=1 Tax=Venturia effusa TaxID=50376 RepID=A0A517LAP1_9PEZI|nr:hypothetical protein FKW77_003407 [Venturia effusa]
MNMSTTWKIDLRLAAERSKVQSQYKGLHPEGTDVGFLKYLNAYPIPMDRVHDPLYLYELLYIAENYHVSPLKAAVIGYFTASLDATWGREAFVDIIVKLYEPSDLEPLYDLRVRVADYVARHVHELDGSVQALLDSMPDFEEDVAAAFNDQRRIEGIVEAIRLWCEEVSLRDDDDTRLDDSIQALLDGMPHAAEDGAATSKDQGHIEDVLEELRLWCEGFSLRNDDVAE